jgi:hypothetical protein
MDSYDTHSHHRGAQQVPAGNHAQSTHLTINWLFDSEISNISNGDKLDMIELEGLEKSLINRKGHG